MIQKLMMPNATNTTVLATVRFDAIGSYLGVIVTVADELNAVVLFVFVAFHICA